MAKEYLIGDFLKRIKRPIDLLDEVDYKLVTVKMNHNGVTLRERKKGYEIKSNMYLVKEGDFILSGIDARNGAFGIIPQELDEAIVTNDFWYFQIDETIILKELFLELTATNWFDEICKKGSDGTTQRIRLQKDKFFNQTVWLPEKNEQSNTFAKIKKIKDKLSILFLENKKQIKLNLDLKQSILSDALQGKLTQEWRMQNQSIEPGWKLFERIIKEKENQLKVLKTRKGKSLLSNSINETPFELPEKWHWCKIQDLIAYSKGKKPEVLSNKKTEKCNIPYVDIAAFEKGIISNYTDGNKIIKCTSENILLVWDGSRMGLTGSNITGAVGSTLIKIDYFIIEKYFLYYLLKSKFAIFNSNPKQSGLPHMNGPAFDNMVIGLPPLEEQKEIIRKIELLLNKSVKLNQEIETLNKNGETLLKALFNETFETKTEEV